MRGLLYLTGPFYLPDYLTISRPEVGSSEKVRRKSREKFAEAPGNETKHVALQETTSSGKLP